MAFNCMQPILNWVLAHYQWEKGEMETKPGTSDNHQSSNTNMCNQSLVALLLRLIMKNSDISVNHRVVCSCFLIQTIHLCHTVAFLAVMILCSVSVLAVYIGLCV